MRYALILLLLVGGASGASDHYAQSEARAVQTVEYGTVGRAAATVIGAVGGGIAGSAIERKIDEEDGEEIVIKLDSGATIAIVQPGAHHLMAGDRVRVLTGPKGSRVERA